MVFQALDKYLVILMSATREKDKDNSVGSRNCCITVILWVTLSQAKVIHSANKYPLPLLCADIVPSTGDTTGTKHNCSYTAEEKTAKQTNTAKQKPMWPEWKGGCDGRYVCAAQKRCLKMTVRKWGGKNFLDSEVEHPRRVRWATGGQYGWRNVWRVGDRARVGT